MTVAENQVLCGAWKDRARCDRGKSALGDGTRWSDRGRERWLGRTDVRSVSPPGRPMMRL
jgi:hypothetical protein